MANEPLSAYVRRCRARPPEGSDWLADEIQVLEDALAHCIARDEEDQREASLARADAFEQWRRWDAHG